MKGSFASGPAVAHKSAGFNARLGYRIWTSAVCDQNSDNAVVSKAAVFAQSSMKRRFSSVRLGLVHVVTEFDQKLTQPPVPVESSGVQLRCQRGGRFAIR
jgi:hypothetical protein